MIQHLGRGAMAITVGMGCASEAGGCWGILGDFGGFLLPTGEADRFCSLSVLSLRRLQHDLPRNLHSCDASSAVPGKHQRAMDRRWNLGPDTHLRQRRIYGRRARGGVSVLSYTLVCCLLTFLPVITPQMNKVFLPFVHARLLLVDANRNPDIDGLQSEPPFRGGRSAHVLTSAAPPRSCRGFTAGKTSTPPSCRTSTSAAILHAWCMHPLSRRGQRSKTRRMTCRRSRTIRGCVLSEHCP